MLKNILCVSTLVLGLFSFAAHANVAITQVTNYQSATNGCTVNSVAGGNQFVIWGVQCPSENGTTVYVKTIWSQYGSCTAESATNGYATSFTCSNYTVYRTQSPSSVASSASSSSTPNCYTQYIDIGFTCNSQGCSEGFGRNCVAAGGTVVRDGYNHSCQKNVCQ